MDDFAIRVTSLSKEYRLGEKQKKYHTLRESLVHAAGIPYRAIQSFRKGSRDDTSDKLRFRALNDVSFNVKQGEVVGIIGHNGAGKSTLLKILSRITEPSKGFAEITGRVGSLLEVGTGFHPELTGRENVYLNGAILGMKRAEIERQFDQIVDFAEIEKFIDTPVKHYSSGMYLRLAFSVAAHLEPEILLVDEVLAVGDMAFQKKCLGKMGDVAAEGRTVLFVSHNLGAIKEMCQTCVVLDKGSLAFHGPATQALIHYSQSLSSSSAEDLFSGGTSWRDISINGQPAGLLTPIHNDAAIRVEASLRLSDDFAKGRLYCLIEDSNGKGVIHNSVTYESNEITKLNPGAYAVKVEIPPLWLMPDAYTLYFKFIGRTDSGSEERSMSERVILNITDRTSRSSGKVRAVLIPPIDWSLTAANVGDKELALAEV
jgi:lipopolysaccharide transport system ATP-binding protein